MQEQNKEELIKILVKQVPIGAFDSETGENLQLKAKKEYEKLNLEQLKQEIKKIIVEQQLDKIRNQVLHLYIAKRNDEASEEISNYLQQKYTFKTIKDDKTSEMWVYVDGIYIPNGETTIKAEVRKLLHESYTTQKVNIIIEKIKTDTYIEQDTFFTEQEKHPYLLPVKNGVLNIKTKELLPFSDEYIFFNKINAKYDPKADCPNIKKFIEQITKTEKDVLIIQELFGFVLCKDYFIEKAFMFYGSNGRNGKSKLLQIMTELLGVDNVSGIGLQELEDDDFAIANLFGKMVNISADLSNNAMNHTGKFKKLTGRDVVQANRKFKNYLKFVNYAKMIFASNELPMVYTVSEAFWLRWVIVEFPYQFLPRKELDCLTGEARANARLQDPDVIKNILSPEELNGLLIWALEGLDRLTSNRDFSHDSSASEVRSEWLRKSSSARAFCEDMLVESVDDYVTKADFQRKYSSYCKEYNLKPQSARVLKAVMEQEIGVSESRPSIDGDRVLVWSGVKWKKKDIITHTGKKQTLISQEEYVDTQEFSSVGDAVAAGYTTLSDLELVGFNSHNIRTACSNGDISEVKPGIYKQL